MIRIAVVDDDREEVQELCELLQFTSLELQEPYTIETFYSGSEFLAQYRKQYELLCLDIDMPEKDGMAVAEEIRRRDSKVLIMFITHMAQMAIRGYEVCAVAEDAADSQVIKSAKRSLLLGSGRRWCAEDFQPGTLLCRSLRPLSLLSRKEWRI